MIGKRLLAVLLPILLAGCAMQPAAVTLLPPQAKLSVLELPAMVSDDALRHVLHTGKKHVPTALLATDRRTLREIVNGALIQALTQARAPALVAADVHFSAEAPPMAIGQPLDAGALAALQSQYPADAYLRVQVTDYGQTPGSWKSAYITFEVVTTLGIGVALYAHRTTRALAGAYLLEEGVEEFGEGYAGFWLVNRLSRPVRIDADLVDARSGAVLWHDSETGMAGWEWKHLWHMDDDTRDELLQISTGKMAQELVTELEGK